MHRDDPTLPHRDDPTVPDARTRASEEADARATHGNVSELDPATEQAAERAEVDLDETREHYEEYLDLAKDVKGEGRIGS